MLIRLSFPYCPYCPYLKYIKGDIAIVGAALFTLFAGALRCAGIRET